MLDGCPDPPMRRGRGALERREGERKFCLLNCEETECDATIAKLLWPLVLIPTNKKRVHTSSSAANIRVQTVTDRRM